MIVLGTKVICEEGKSYAVEYDYQFIHPETGSEVTDPFGNPHQVVYSWKDQKKRGF
jgi:hypothetical protein